MIGKEQQEASLAEANQNPPNIYEIVVPRCDEDNVGEGMGHIKFSAQMWDLNAISYVSQTF